MAGGEDAVDEKTRAVAPAQTTELILSLHSDWLERTDEQLRTRQTPWEGYHRAELVSAQELDMLRAAERAGRDGDMRKVVEQVRAAT